LDQLELLASALLESECSIRSLCIPVFLMQPNQIKLNFNLLNKVLQKNTKITHIAMDLQNEIAETHPDAPKLPRQYQWLLSGLETNLFHSVNSISLLHAHHTTIAEFFRVLACNRTITKLTMKNWENSSEYNERLLNFIRSNQTIKSLVLPRPNYDTNFYTKFSDALKINNTLTNLTIEAPIQSYGVETLAAALTVNRTLQRIFIAITDANARYILDAFVNVLKVNETLIELELKYPYMGTNRFFNLAHNLRQLIAANSSLNRLRILNMSCDSVIPSDFNNNELLPALQRNEIYQKEMLANMIIILFNIARRPEETSRIFPVDIWRTLLKYVEYPGRQIDYVAIFDQLRINSTVRRVID
jgi:hypothetical protein